MNCEGSDLAPVFEMDMPLETEVVMPKQLEVGEKKQHALCIPKTVAGTYEYADDDVPFDSMMMIGSTCTGDNCNTVGATDRCGKNNFLEAALMMGNNGNNLDPPVVLVAEEESLSPITPMSPFYPSVSSANQHHHRNKIYAGHENSSFAFPGSMHARCHVHYAHNADGNDLSYNFMKNSRPHTHDSSPSVFLPDLYETSSEGSLASSISRAAADYNTGSVGSAASFATATCTSAQEEFKQRFLASCRGRSNSVTDFRKAFDVTRRMESQRFEPAGKLEQEAVRRVRFFPHVVVIACKRAKVAPSDLWYQDEDYMKFRVYDYYDDDDDEKDEDDHRSDDEDDEESSSFSSSSSSCFLASVGGGDTSSSGVIFYDDFHNNMRAASNAEKYHGAQCAVS
uniref:Uncharacterized protein n=1 Tax=Leptocylindrus danicus TaxID=163516 RepID=A0A7S2KCC9_9STRA|mmetsp:Transcript_20749/g.30912  ORF Transcript_20749/g.30912 Transcript_20749/m.30912 type:complete len:396 (+) Transcript_20749:1078-2265(+)|eukprot:CAMPEP_0116044148 /NCGR_PEP_ID=MMETSP0321-20121206/26835_1 /TAXON_ID=163516 /ORGANISM="Leptocylindrus danicus var. danicus, Strain B650" /LENGTH=395 /DNA_ID=CAMNT_0003525205 /DNA_START=773 /DNA_END=1960 /DNA_ORIENTATION=-